jgi:hypothetical protein
MRQVMGKGDACDIAAIDILKSWSKFAI